MYSLSSTKKKDIKHVHVSLLEVEYDSYLSTWLILPHVGQGEQTIRNSTMKWIAALNHDNQIVPFIILLLRFEYNVIEEYFSLWRTQTVSGEVEGGGLERINDISIHFSEERRFEIHVLERGQKNV